MIRLFTLLFLALLSFASMYAGKRQTIKGVQYETAEDNTATATLTVQAKGEVTILESIKIGQQRYLVTEVKEAYFKKNASVTSVTLPKTLKVIRSGAFHGCSNLTRLMLPTSFYDIEVAAFEGCNNITTLDGNLSPFVEYQNKSGNISLSNSYGRPVIPKFSTYANEKLKQKMEIWQTKKDYETVEQYKNRVTDENRRKRMDEFVGELEQEYVGIYAPSSVSSVLGYYDSEYGVFTIKTMFYGNVFAKVPKAESDIFRKSYQKVQLVPNFGIQGDTLSLKGCKFVLDGKTYDSAINYAGSGENNYNFELPPLDINLAATAVPALSTPVSIDNAVDKNIPKGKQNNMKTFALIIGNEQYKRVSQVPFANNDAKVFAEYCKKTLGLPANNVKLYLNAGLNDMRHAVIALINTLKAYDGEAKAIVYYAGHGMPDESNRMPYLLPVDGFATDIKSGYNLSDLYDELAEAPSQMTMVLLDACFSGTKREGDMLADARGVAIEARSTMPTGNLLVFSASQGSETAYSDKAHGHGMFTYYLLKHLQETASNTTMSKLTDYVITNVKRSSVTVNDGKMQTPTIIPSSSLMNTWQNLNFK